MATGPLAGSSLPFQDPVVEGMRGKFNGVYLGFVRDRSDPTMTGRVRVYVPVLLGDDGGSDTWLDWCLPKSAGLAVPPMGAPVYVTFEQGYVTHGIYEWGWLRGEDPKSSDAPLAGKEQQDPAWSPQIVASSGGEGQKVGETFPPDPAKSTVPVYPYNKVWQSEGGHILEIDDSPGALRARYKHPSGTTLFIDPDGNVHIRSAGAILQEAVGDQTIMLGAGSSFKVMYPGGGGLTVGASGVALSGSQFLIGDRVVQRSGVDIK